MQFTNEKAAFFQCGFNFYIGDIDDESTIIFKEDFIVIGNITTVKNIFAMGELIVVGNIECKSIYVSKDFLCLGNIDTELIDVEGKSQVIAIEELKNKLLLETIDKINNVEEGHHKEQIDDTNKHSDSNTSNKQSGMSIINKDKVGDINKLYETYISKKGDIVFGKILRIEDDKYIINLDNVEAILMKNKERKFRIDEEIGAYIKNVKNNGSNLEVLLEENNRSYIAKIIKLEMKKNKYDPNKVFIKEIHKKEDGKYVVDIYSNQHTQETLYIIEKKLRKYLNGRDIKLHIYQRKNSIKKEIQAETDKSFNKVLEEVKINKYNSINGFFIGDKIYHKIFGEGEIVFIVDKDIAQIEFNGEVKDLNLNYLIKNGLISKDNIYSNDVKIYDLNDKQNDKLETIPTSKVKILEKYKQKKYSLIECNVLSINENCVKFNINNEAIGILRKENDCVKSKSYSIGDKVICCISSVYIREGKVEIQMYRNTSNFFKLLFNKYKEELNLKKCNLKLCKFIENLGAKIIVERKNGFNDELILKYINQLINLDVGEDIVKIIILQYSPYSFLSELFNIDQSSIQFKNNIYYINNISKEHVEPVNEIINELHKVVSYKVSISN